MRAAVELQARGLAPPVPGRARHAPRGLGSGPCASPSPSHCSPPSCLAPSASATAPVATASKGCSIRRLARLRHHLRDQDQRERHVVPGGPEPDPRLPRLPPRQVGQVPQRQGLLVLRAPLQQGRTHPYDSNVTCRKGGKTVKHRLYAVHLARLRLAAAGPAVGARAGRGAGHRAGGATVDAGPLTGTGERARRRAGRAGRAGVTAVHLRCRCADGLDQLPRRARASCFTGFGERSNAVDQRGRDVLNYTADGPFLERDRAIAGAAVPDWAELDRPRRDLLPDPLAALEPRLRRAGRQRRDQPLPARRAGAGASRPTAGRLDLRVFAGPRPADALRRFTAATGRQPATAGARGRTGPGSRPASPTSWRSTRRRASSARCARRTRPVSAAETQMHFLPCGAHRLARRTSSSARSSSTPPGWLTWPTSTRTCAWPTSRSSARPRRPGALQRGSDGEPITFPAFVGGEGPAGSAIEPLAQFDFTGRPPSGSTRGCCARRSPRARTAGWRTSASGPRPRASTTASRATTTAPCATSCGASTARWCASSAQAGRATARCSVDVWGGDPTTVWGFDGLRSAVTQALTIGMSGVARWGSDIGGYNSFGAKRAPDAGAARSAGSSWARCRA